MRGSFTGQHASRVSPSRARSIFNMLIGSSRISKRHDWPWAALRTLRRAACHITVEADFALAYVAPILPDFLDRYPEVQVRLSMSAGMMDLVDSGIDLAIRIGHLEDSSLIARKIAMSRSPGLPPVPHTSSGTARPHIPANSKRIVASPSEPDRGKTLGASSCRKARSTYPYRVASTRIALFFLRNAALAGLGIIMVPAWIIRNELKRGLLLPLLEDFPLVPSSTPIHAVFAHNRHLAPKVRAFVDFLAERMETL